MRAHQIDENGFILQTIVVPDLDFMPGLVPDIGGQIGDRIVDGVIAPEAPKMDELRAAKNADIDRWRAEANATVFPYGGKEIAVDDLSWKDILSTAGHIALLGSFPPDWPGGWKTTDKKYIPMPAIDDFKAMYAAMAARGTENFNHSQFLKVALAKATTPEEIAAIQW